ncbi:MAG: LysM peptidoglycan-binding domain-containing protein [Candidatus Fimadaptatus sp.]
MQQAFRLTADNEYERPGMSELPMDGDAAQQDTQDAGIPEDGMAVLPDTEPDAPDMGAAQDDTYGASGRSGQTITSRVCPRGQTRYTWRSTDTLEGVAARYGVRPDAIREANPGVIFTRLNFGDEICVPMARVSCPSGELYRVRRGDTFASIAAAHGITVARLSELNPYADPAALQAGQLLCVPENRPVTPIAPPGQPPVYPDVPDCPNCTVRPPARPCASDNISIIMPMGWSLGTVLTRYNISYDALSAANPGLNIEAIPAGQQICLPPPGTRRLCAEGARSHVIERGESLNSLARRFDTTPTHLLRLNPSLAPSDFIAGRVICAPGAV